VLGVDLHLARHQVFAQLRHEVLGSVLTTAQVLGPLKERGSIVGREVTEAPLTLVKTPRTTCGILSDFERD
jgi:hypothetical protein